MGKGLLIDPTDGRICAPVGGEIISVADTRHAVTLRAAAGLELLIHIGIDTVALKGEGFRTHVSDGQKVEAGDLLISADLDFLAANAKSLQTPIVITNSDDFEIARRVKDQLVSAGDFLMEVKVCAGRTEAAPHHNGGEGSASKKVRVPLPLGLHARPAAKIAAIAKSFEAGVTISTADKGGNGRSVVSIMGLAVRCGDEIDISAFGIDAEKAVDALAREIEAGLGEEIAPVPVNSATAEAVSSEPIEPLALPATVRGVGAAQGVAIGTLRQLTRRDWTPPEAGAGPAAESAALRKGVDRVRRRLETAAADQSAVIQGVFSAHRELLDDPELHGAAQAMIDAGKNAAYAWHTVLRDQAERFAALNDRLLAQRADDLHDLGRQVVAAIMDADPEHNGQVFKDAIVVADDLAPSDFVRCLADGAAGFCTTGGGVTSHVSIMAADVGAPLLVAAGKNVRAAPDGVAAILHTGRGELLIGAGEEEIAGAKSAITRYKKRHAEALAQCDISAQTVDGVRIECLANLGSAEDAVRAVKVGAEGCGLLRSEFLFLRRTAPPDEGEQRAAYQEIADALGARPLVIRTLDIGGDKPAPYLPSAPEENPALGLRGVRLTLQRPSLLKTQLRAIMQVGPRPPDIMLPMISGADEITAVRELFEDAVAAIKPATRPRLGIMIETPASAVLSETFAALVDFFSIGSNDLTQYVLAMDRGAAELASGFDGLHPAVLRMIKQVVDAAAAQNTPVSLCGALASDPVAIPVLLGLGVKKLSAALTAAPAVKAVIRSVVFSECESLAESALDQPNARAVRRAVVSQWPTIEDWN